MFLLYCIYFILDYMYLVALVTCRVKILHTKHDHLIKYDALFCSKIPQIMQIYQLPH